MLADIISRVLVMVLGYAYPAFQCFKTVEKNKVEIEELRFWCQYWIIVALLAVVERISDIFISWVPMYAEIKLAIFLYMWYPKTKGTGFIYETLLRPFVAKHETDIERSLQEMRTRAWDLAIYYYHNCTELGQTKFFQVIDYLTSQSGRIKKGSSEKGRKIDKSKGNAPPPPDTIFSFNNQPPAPTPSAPPLYSQPQESQFTHFMTNQEPQFDRPADHRGSRLGFRHRKGSH